MLGFRYKSLEKRFVCVINHSKKRKEKKRKGEEEEIIIGKCVPK
jgi:hypothetical protein